MKLLKTALPLTLVAFCCFFIAQSISFSDFKKAIQLTRELTPKHFLSLSLLTITAYLSYIGYDLISAQYLQLKLPLKILSRNALVIYSLGNSLGSLAGATFRLALYRSQQLPTSLLLKWHASTYFIYILGWPPLLIYSSNDPKTRALLDAFDLSLHHLLGLGALLLLSAALVLKGARQRQHSWNFDKPSKKLLLQALGVSLFELVAPAMLLLSCFPSLQIGDFSSILALYGLSVAMAALGSLPAGLGALEFLALAQLQETLSNAEILSGLILFRTFFYLLPALLGLFTFWQHRKTLQI